jgi:hypothetical protein
MKCRITPETLGMIQEDHNPGWETQVTPEAADRLIRRQDAITVPIGSGHFPERIDIWECVVKIEKRVSLKSMQSLSPRRDSNPRSSAYKEVQRLFPFLQVLLQSVGHLFGRFTGSLEQVGWPENSTIHARS